jgi:hypothetical protein
VPHRGRKQFGEYRQFIHYIVSLSNSAHDVIMETILLVHSQRVKDRSALCRWSGVLHSLPMKCSYMLAEGGYKSRKHAVLIIGNITKHYSHHFGEGTCFRSGDISSIERLQSRKAHSITSHLGTASLNNPSSP